MIPGMVGAVSGVGFGKAAPVVVSHAGQNVGGSETSWNVSLPSIVAGNRGFIFFSGSAVSNPGGSMNTPSGWTKVYDRTDVNANLRKSAMFTKILAGDEGSSVSVSTSGSAMSAGWVFIQVSGTECEYDNTPIGTNSSPDPASLTPTWSDPTLWLAARIGNNQAVTSPPSGFSFVENHERATVAQMTAANGNAVDPGAFTMAGNNPWHAVTMAVRGG